MELFEDQVTLCVSTNGTVQAVAWELSPSFPQCIFRDKEPPPAFFFPCTKGITKKTRHQYTTIQSPNPIIFSRLKLLTSTVISGDIKLFQTNLHSSQQREISWCGVFSIGATPPPKSEPSVCLSLWPWVTRSPNPHGWRLIYMTWCTCRSSYVTCQCQCIYIYTHVYTYIYGGFLGVEKGMGLSHWFFLAASVTNQANANQPYSTSKCYSAICWDALLPSNSPQLFHF